MEQQAQHTICPGCGLKLPEKQLPPNDRYNASGECTELYWQLSFYTLAKQDEDFIHQLLVDTYGAQHSGGITKRITTAFALAGLYLYLEKGYSGARVQEIHLLMAQNKTYEWPAFAPAQNNTMTIADVVHATDKDEQLLKWARSVWRNYESAKPQIIQMIEELLGPL